MSNALYLSNSATRIAAGALAVAATFGLVSTVHAKTGADFHQAVESSINRELNSASTRVDDGHRGVATLAVSVDREGKVRSVALVKSSGESGFDKEALRIAHRVSYPASGAPHTLAMVLGFNQHADKRAQAKGAELVQAWLGSQQKMRLAEKTTAQQPDS